MSDRNQYKPMPMSSLTLSFSLVLRAGKQQVTITSNSNLSWCLAKPHVVCGTQFYIHLLIMTIVVESGMVEITSL